MCLCLARATWVERGEWLRGLGLGFINPVRGGGGGGGGVGRVSAFELRWCGWCMWIMGTWQRAWTRVWMAWVVLCLCDL